MCVDRRFLAMLFVFGNQTKITVDFVSFWACASDRIVCVGELFAHNSIDSLNLSASLFRLLCVELGGTCQHSVCVFPRYWMLSRFVAR